MWPVDHLTSPCLFFTFDQSPKVFWGTWFFSCSCLTDLVKRLSFDMCIMTFVYHVLSSVFALLCDTFWSSVVSLSFLPFQKLLVSARILSNKQWKPSPASPMRNGSIGRLLGSSHNCQEGWRTGPASSVGTRRPHCSDAVEQVTRTEKASTVT